MTIIQPPLDNILEVVWKLHRQYCKIMDDNVSQQWVFGVAAGG